MKKIDIHCHTTNRHVADVLTDSVSISAILKYMKQYDIVKTNLLATYFPHKNSGISNFRMLDWIRGKEEFCMFGSLDFENYFNQGMNELDELADKGLIKGVKLYTCYQNIDLKSEKFGDVVNLAEYYNIPLMFHCGYSYTSKRKYGKPSITEMVKASDLEFIEGPDVIISHMSKPFFDDTIAVLKRRSNFFTDISGLVDSKYDRAEIPGDIEAIKKLLGECGSSRLMFGTDFPVQTHEDSVNFIERTMKDFPEKDRENVYFNNAERVILNRR
jgi:predicted TIM-barrel fold metal-dependent hydrolase